MFLHPYLSKGALMANLGGTAKVRTFVPLGDEVWFFIFKLKLFKSNDGAQVDRFELSREEGS